MGEWQNPHHRADMQTNTTLGNKNSEKVKVKQVNGNTPIIRADIHTNKHNLEEEIKNKVKVKNRNTI